MNAYVFLFTFICEVAAIENEDFNVGTVLFSPSDTKKKLWSVREIGLLRARRHFQALIPPPSMINTNEDFINTLLDYFKDSYSSVKSEANDPVTSSIMNAALSDAIGGYLSSWVLPITKFAYYGGTVSQEDAAKLFQLYKEIKQGLNTNGRTWRKPNTNLLNSVSINVASLRSSNVRDVDHPCDSLAFLEKTNTGLAIPVPSVNWNRDTASIFVPLKNQSLIPLDSTNNESLIKYYNAATNCIEASKLEKPGEFETRFQKWLVQEVIPHLNDDVFYPALGNVLSLVNKTRNLVDTVISIYAENPTMSTKTFFAGIPVNISSKKMMVIAVIIILEVAWCIPTLCYLLCVRIRRNKSNSACNLAETGKGKKSCSSENTQVPSNNMCNETSCLQDIQQNSRSKHAVRNKCSQSTQGVTLIHLPRPQSCNINTLHSNILLKPTGIGTRSCHSSQMHHQDITRIIQERSIQTRDSISKKNSVDEFGARKSSTSREVYSCITGTKSANITNSLTMNQELEPTKTVTIFRERNKNSRIVEIIKDDKETQLPNTSVKQKKDSPSIETDDASVNTSKEYTKRIKSREKLAKFSTDPMTNQNFKTSRYKNPRNIKDTKTTYLPRGGSKMNSGKPYLEITIDRARRKQIEYSKSHEQELKGKQSRIPKRTFNSSAAQTLTIATKNIQIPSLPKRKSYIPQPKRQRTVDDIIIKRKKTATQNDALNVTF